MILYHGSPRLFNSFDYQYVGENGTNEGKGFYFSDSIEIASSYAIDKEGKDGYLYKVKLDLKESITEQGKRFSIDDYKRFVVALQKERDFLSCYGDVSYEGFETVLHNAVTNEYEYCDNDVDILCSIANACGSLEAVNRIACEVLGINYILAEQVEWGQQRKKGHKVYVALIPEMIKIVEVIPMSRLAINVG